MRIQGLIFGAAIVAMVLQTLPAAAQAPSAMSLADFVAFAEQRNPQIAAARQAVTAADARVLLARAGRGPVISLSVSPGISGGTSAQATQGFGTAASITASYVLYDSGQIAFAVRQAEANAQVARLTLEAVRQDVALGVAVAYVNALRAERNVRLREQIVVLNRELLRLAEGQLRAGIVSRADLVRAQAGLAAAEGELIAARNAVDQAAAALNTAVGRPASTPVAVAPALAVPRLTLTDTALAALIEDRPEVKRAMAEIDAAEAGLALARTVQSLRVNLEGRATQSYNSSSSPNTWSLGTTMSFPVFDAGKGAASVAEATANLAAARSRSEVTRLLVQQQGLQAYLAVLDARARLASASAGLMFAQEWLRLAHGRYQAGLASIVELTDAQTVLVQADVALQRAEYDELAAAIALRHAVGRSVVTGAI